MEQTARLEALALESQTNRTVADELRTSVSGGIALPGEESYLDACRLWNGAVNHRPAMIAFCKQPMDVEATVRIARHRGLPLSVRGGGHDWAGRALFPDGLVIDLTRMRDVIVDPQEEVATVAGGATIKDVAAAAAEHGFVAAVGNCSAVGMASLTLGGGYGPLNGRYGMAADNLLGAEVVLADGRSVTTNADDNPDLFWAIRGGGGNFGVVTSMRIRLHRAGHLLAGSIIFPLSEAGAVLRRYAKFAVAVPDELGMAFAMMSGPDGQPALALMPLWNGDKEQGECVLHDLQSLGTPHRAQVGPMSFGDILAQSDPFVALGRQWEVRTRWLPALKADAVDVMSDAIVRKTSPHSLVIWHPLHGAATRVAPNATAFGMRREHLMVEIIACWEPDESDGSAHRRWARDLSQKLAPSALPGGYANLLGPGDREQAQDAYGGNGARLRTLKRRFDPDGVFSSAIPLPD